MIRPAIVLATVLSCATQLAGCRDKQPASVAPSPDVRSGQPKGELRSLGGGKEIRVVEITRDEGPPRVIEIEYWTDIPLSDRANLQAEVEAVWAGLMHKEAEDAKAVRAYIYPRTPDSGDGRFTDRTTSFSYVRDQEGTWSKAGGFGDKATRSPR